MTERYQEDYCLTIFDSYKEPYEIKLSDFKKETISFGRQSDCDIVLTSEYASRVHGCFYMKDGKWLVHDLDSKNGLVCRSKKVKDLSLRDGDYIRIVSSKKNMEAGVLIVFSIKKADEKWVSISLGKQDFSGNGRVTIGRDESNTICLPHISVSHQHAYITKEGDSYYIYDNHSTNKVLVNGGILSRKHRLEDKDLIVITNTKLIFSKGELRYNIALKGIKVEAANIVKKVGKNNRLTITDDVTLTIEPGELVAIVGGSGAGKSTIMNCISGYSKPTSGQVLVNGIDLYSNFEALKNIIGYVPQQDIVYDNLTVYDMLMYSAKLRLPKDVKQDEVEAIVNKVIDTVELSHRKDAMVRSLSGGQKKRASIAVELLTDPNLFFLDEPASGLDPGTERSLIRTLKGMTATGKTVILVTHSTMNFSDYDKIVFMGTGGKLCFCGSYREALAFFETKDIVDVYDMLSRNTDYWHDKYEKQRSHSSNANVETKDNKQVAKKGFFRQLGVLCLRYMHLLINDKQRMLLFLIQAPLLAVLISIVGNDDVFEKYEMTKSILFALSCSAFWIGILSSIQEVCKERNILKREYMTGLNIWSYITSKMLVLGILCLIQTILIVTVFSLLVGLPEEGIIMAPYLEYLISTLLTAMSAAAMGIFVSSLFKNADRAMTVAPILLMPQILFSGLIFSLKDASEVIAYFVVCRWSMEGYGTTTNLNELETKMQALGFEHSPEVYFDYTNEHILLAWAMMFAFVVVFSLIAGLVLTRIKSSDEK